MKSKVVKHDGDRNVCRWFQLWIFAAVSLKSNEIVPEHLVHLDYRTVTCTPAEKQYFL